MAVGVLHALGRSDEAIERFGARDNVEQILGMLMRGSRCPPTTSLGRWFDAAAGLLGVCETMTYEGQAPMLLESLARRFGTILPLPGGHHIDVRPDSGLSVLNLYPLLNQLVGEGDAAKGAAHFHANLVEALVEWMAEAAHATGVRTLVLSGGCMHNRLLAVGMRQRLAGRGLRVFEAQHVPAGDGGLSLGQAWVARAQLMRGGL